MTNPSIAGVVAFVGGGNMAQALIGGLRSAGRPASAIRVVEPLEATRQGLAERFGVVAQPAADAALAEASLVVWAVKPQRFAEAAAAAAPHVAGALQLSVMAGVRSGAIARALGLEPAAARIVRAMPNTPALIGRGITGLHAPAAVTAAERDAIDALLAPTGGRVWVAAESDLDAVTALSGSGPAYVFYLLEAMIAAGERMGLPPAQARELAQATVAGAAALATQSPLPAAALRAQVTSPGGTTHAAITSLEAAGVGEAFGRAIEAARRRAQELGDAA